MHHENARLDLPVSGIEVSSILSPFQSGKTLIAVQASLGVIVWSLRAEQKIETAVVDGWGEGDDQMAEGDRCSGYCSEL